MLNILFLMNRVTRAKIAALRFRWLLGRGFSKMGVSDHIPNLSTAGPIPKEELDDILASFDDSVVFVHVGLSDIDSAFDGNPYKYLLDRLRHHFDTILAPGFTPSFRETGIYHKQFSCPEYGMFSRLFLEDASHRTNDAIHSILIDGNYNFEEANHFETFGENGCWQQLDQDDVLYLNIGVSEFRCTQLHYIEHTLNLPYIEEPTHDGVVYHNETDYERITQINRTYDPSATVNWSKVRRYLEDTGVLKDYSRNNLHVTAVRSRELRRSLEKRLAKDPYFLIT